MGWSSRTTGDRRPHRPGLRHGAPLAVVIALVQAVGTTFAARGQPLELDLLGYALLIVGGLALADRHRFPVATVAVTATATVAYQALDYPRGPTFVAVIIAAIVAVKAGHRYPVWVVAAAGYVAWVVLTGPGVNQALVLAAWTAGVLLVAEWARAAVLHRARAAEIREEQRRLREEQQRRQAIQERLRIAQELHDVLGHHLSLINVQAGVGLHLMDRQPDQARDALGTIKQASAEALREVRSVLAALHPEGEAAPRTPSPRLERLDDLTVDAGIPVHATVHGQPRALPAELDRAAYRIVQEALTNTRRHAGVGATATVVIEYRPEELVLRVDDDGGGAARPAPGEEGSGISGMRERVTALGGTLAAGPRPDGGFQVHARLPLSPVTEPRGAP